MDKLFEFSHLHMWVGDVDTFKRFCEQTLGWRATHYAPGIMVSFDELPQVAFEHGHDSKFQLGVKSLDARSDARDLETRGLVPARAPEAKPDGRVQAWFQLQGNGAIELEEDWNAISLLPPNARFRESFLAAVKEFQAEGRMKDLDANMAPEDFHAYIARLAEERHTRTAERVPHSVWWGVCNGEYLGRISLRHELTPWLGRIGGHVGYEVRPKYRNKGVAKALLRGVLPHVRALGLPQVVITCDEGNTASRRVAESCGARYVGRFTPAEAQVPAKLHFVLDVH